MNKLSDVEKIELLSNELVFTRTLASCIKRLSFQMSRRSRQMSPSETLGNQIIALRQKVKLIQMIKVSDPHLQYKLPHTAC